MINASLTQESRTTTTREDRALALYRERGDEIREVSADVFRVPSCTGRGTYQVDYAEETCQCPDFTYRDETCKHLLAVGVFYAKARRRADTQDHPHACQNGYVYLGYTSEDGEEVVEALSCRRCAND